MAGKVGRPKGEVRRERSVRVRVSDEEHATIAAAAAATNRKPGTFMRESALAAADEVAPEASPPD